MSMICGASKEKDGMEKENVLYEETFFRGVLSFLLVLTMMPATVLADEPVVLSPTEAFAEVDEVTPLNYSETYTLGSEEIFYSNDYRPGEKLYGKMIKLYSEKDAVVTVDFYGADEPVDTAIYLYEEYDGDDGMVALYIRQLQ